MATGATGQLGLALPVQGELSGTWGDTVNNGITQYTNIAIAGTLTLTGDGAVTLANTTGDASASNITSTLTGAGTVTAQFAIVKVTGTLTTPKIITAPSYSKTYVVVNSATGSTVSFIRSGQTPAVSIAVGETAFVYYNGTDYVKLTSTSSGAAGGSTTQVQYNNAGVLAGSSSFVFDGTNVGIGTSSPADLLDISASVPEFRLTSTSGPYSLVTSNTAGTLQLMADEGNTGASTSMRFRVDAAEVARFDSSGDLGLGVIPSAWNLFKALEVGRVGNSFAARPDASQVNIGANWYYASGDIYANTGAASMYEQASGVHRWYTAASGTAGNAITFTQQFAINNSGAIGLGSGNSTGTVGQVLTSQGSGAAPTWAAGGGGGSGGTGANLYLAVNFGGF